MALSVRVCLAPNLEISSTEMSSSRRIQANSRRKLNLYTKKKKITGQYGFIVDMPKLGFGNSND